MGCDHACAVGRHSDDLIITSMHEYIDRLCITVDVTQSTEFTSPKVRTDLVYNTDCNDEVHSAPFSTLFRVLFEIREM